ncbi:hypothetical protein B0T26DRAFT_871181 [Lasiosphaeria miniovina]|uniref:C2H2-type domain-containing protein n=1 Tax=Lasiosphaeria miniovina TaxID=1954250 RepID=A0AA40AWJ0_9PEZI|nr:uncharacterized protein B0T26DRAFT_871181 [Lasiosphaeria miniovina]KAK0723299.1 hypothetical protein B0T26DRAFT_871181 [Lasiosphaeria miniovina]
MMEHIPASLSLVPPTSTLSTNVDYRLEITEADDEVIKVEYPAADNRQLVRQYSLTEAHFILEYPFERRYPFNDFRQETLRRTDHATEATTNRSRHSASTSTGSSSEKTSVFADLDQRIARSMQADPSLGSAEAVIRTLHSLPGGPRALVYGFDSVLGGADGENAARSFRCPFEIIHPQVQRSPSCKEPILYSSAQLWKHLKRYHRSYECDICLEDCRDSKGIKSHVGRGCIPTTRPPHGVPFMQVQDVEEVLDPDIGDSSDEERWNSMWDTIFPTLRNRPSPYFNVPVVATDSDFDGDLMRLQVIFASMIDSDAGDRDTIDSCDNDTIVAKTRAKRYLRAAIQAFLGRQLEPWAGLLTEPRVDVDSSDISSGPGPSARSFLGMMGDDGRY